MADIEDIKQKLHGVVVENEQNKQFTDNIKSIENMMDLVEGYLDNLSNDKVSLEAYFNKLQVLKKRGFKVSNAIARLKYQIESTQASIENLSSQKKNRLVLLKNDILELTRNVLDYRILIDDKDDNTVQNLIADLNVYDTIDDTITISDIMKLAIISMSHMADLQEDVYKFDPQIQEAEQYRDRNFDVGDLVETLQMQKETTQTKHHTYSGFYVDTSHKHLDRTRKYITELAETASKVREETESKTETDNSRIQQTDDTENSEKETQQNPDETKDDAQ